MSKKLPDNPTRKMFLDAYKKFKNQFVFSLHAVIHDPNTISDLRYGLDLVGFIVTSLDRPKEMWDLATDDQRKSFWAIMLNAIDLRRRNLEAEISDLNELTESFLNQDTSKLNEVEQENEEDEGDYDDGGTMVLLPSILYHGTLRENIDSIMSVGLRPQGRKHKVFLNDTKEKAEKTALRHGPNVVVLSINTATFIGCGNSIEVEDFGHGDVWLTDEISPEFLEEVQKD